MSQQMIIVKAMHINHVKMKESVGSPNGFA